MFRLGVLEGSERRVVVEAAGHTYALADVTGDPAPASLDQLLPEWDANIDRIGRAVDAVRPEHAIDFDGAVFAPPVARPSKVICVGINYRDHIAEMNAAAPDYPYAFLRPPSSLAGHGQSIALPEWPSMVDWEAELGVVIGRRARGLTAGNALDAVAGYTIVNDVSARDWIESAPFVGIDWVMQKAWDAFQPTGPWITPASFVPDPQALDVELTVNGTVKQRQSTAGMVFGVADILVHLSRIMTLEPGDIIATGTPAGVGFGRNPREFLKSGDEVSVAIGGLGTLTNRFE